MNDWRMLKQGKIRDMLYNPNTGQVAIVTSDRVSAFDRVLASEIPSKGKILTEISLAWGELIDESELHSTEPATAILDDLVTAHAQRTLLGQEHQFQIYGRAEALEAKAFDRDPFVGHTVIMERLDMLPIECIVRGYLTGSGLKSYRETGAVCGIKLPDGLTEASKLPEPIYTPTTKANIGAHDEHITFEDTMLYIDEAFPDRGRELAELARDYSLALYREAEKYARDRGIIIADTKFEFGVDRSGRLVLGDEILTPDSSRFWPVEGYEPGKVQPSFDKQPIRDFIASHPGYETKDLPWGVINKTQRRYAEILKILFDREIELDQGAQHRPEQFL